MRVTSLLLACGLVATLSACGGINDADRQRITAEIERQVKDAYDLTKPDVEQRLLSLYPDTGRIVSASMGHMVTSRDTVFSGIRYFWRAIGANMRKPQWIWDRMLIDVLSPDAAVMTATYRIPHFTPRNQPHTISGAWTAVLRRQGAKWVIVQEHLSDVPTPPAAAAPVDTTGQ